ncbi:flagellar biosynthesis protein FlgG [Desulfovibrio mangrovi]|uniref:flagellar basal body rod C-terminal domain-containing protein n=1 Tax=Desulfovibrio mangrovi TaxID=2976983 RepID=UPI00224652C1|nr:flagellar basal body rod C-terminal domain-containing protein [Desulfovibrio mangrovi]UZP67170.1 flagellar biosynthesis protein FlgG [Desulfovibrio mangrovi]
MRIDANLSALDAIALSQQVTANDIANVNTDEFKSSDVRLETGPEGEGVQVSEIRQDSSPGPVTHYPDLQVEASGGDGAVQEVVEGSNTDYVRETVNMIRDENAYAANVRAIRSQVELIGNFIDEVA